MMGSFPRIVFFYTILFLIKPTFPQQYYDTSNCFAKSHVLGSDYLCTVQNSQCQTYIAYRAQEGFLSLSSIASLFNVDPYAHDLFTLNNITEAESNNLHVGREAIIPINCTCPDRFSRAIMMYNFSLSDSFDGVACGDFQGLAKAQSLVEENPDLGGGSNHDNAMIKVPIRCACPSDDQRRNGVKYLVTYPIMENDHVNLMGQKFGVTEDLIWEANRLQPFAGIFPGTTLLIPIKDVTFMNWELVSSPQDPPPSPTEMIPVKKDALDGQKSTSSKSYVILVVSVLAMIILTVLAFVLCLRFWKRNDHLRSFEPLSLPKSSKLSNFSPDFLDGMSKLKHSLISFSLEELRIATEDFSDSSVIGSAVYRGRIGSSYVAIEEVSSGAEVHHVIDILTRINHLNVVKLEGCCFGTKSYIVLEFAGNGSLRDCLSRVNTTGKLTWKIRMQIAFDLAVGLHYVHCCTKPSYVHMNINSRNVLITTDWRAKISGFRFAKPLAYTEEKEETKWTDSVIVGKIGYLAPEYYDYGLASAKVDIFAFGVVLIELLSGKVASAEGKILKELVKFLTDIGLEGPPGCLEKLKDFMDPALEADFELSDAICLAFLAKACVEDDPCNRPTMNDVLKALSRIA